MLFFGDTHLSPEDPAKMATVCRFLDTVGRQSARIYCVGDLFDYWLGPAHARLPDFQPILRALERLVRQGVRVDFIHGNRDFHVGSSFTHGLGIPVHPRGTSLWVAGHDVRIHVSHGDLFCTRDVRYQKMRRLIRSWVCRELFGALPMSWREPLAQRMRGASRKEIAAKSQADMGIAAAAVARWFERGYDAVVCGHVHRAERVPYPSEGAPRTLYTLGDWSAERGSYLQWSQGRFQLREFGG